MKLSAFHKAKGDEVYLNFPLVQPDATYASCVFTKNLLKLFAFPSNMTIGGPGSGFKTKLPPEVEHIMPDYSLYGLKHSMGFTSRGCIRHCPWCIVPDLEGMVQPWAEIYEFWDRSHDKIILLDNNLLAAPNWKKTLEDLARERVRVDFNQGLDIRLIDEEKANCLARVAFTKWLRFSFDEPAMETDVRGGIAALQKAGISPSRLMFYLLVGFDTSYKQDMERISMLRGYNCDYFAMQYQPVNGVMRRVVWDGPGRLEEFCRWINVKRLHRNMGYTRWLKYRRVRSA